MMSGLPLTLDGVGLTLGIFADDSNASRDDHRYPRLTFSRGTGEELAYRR